MIFTLLPSSGARLKENNNSEDVAKAKTAILKSSM
jgi:hypothetical protein